MELSTLELQQLKKHAQRASKGQTVASRARQALQVFLAQHGADQVVRDQRPRNGPVVVIDLSEDEPVVQQRPARQQEAPAPQADPAVHEAPLQNLDAPTPQQLSDARDLASELGSLCYAIERVQPVVQDVIQLSEAREMEHTNAEMPLLPPTAMFTCPVCLDDEVSVQDAFSIERCGHRVCRPCALRLVDHNIKQLQPQCCPQCQGAPCPRCPTTIHTQTKEALERCQRRQKERVDACVEKRPYNPLHNRRRLAPNGAEPLARPVGWGHPADESDHEPDVSDGDADGSEPDENGGRIGGLWGAAGARNEAPKVKHCCMSQADMRLLLQPEQLQQMQVQRREAKKQRRERRARRKAAAEAAAAAAAAAEAQAAAGSSKRRRRGAATAADTSGGAASSKKKGLTVTAVPSRFGRGMVPMVNISDSEDTDNDHNSSAAKRSNQPQQPAANAAAGAAGSSRGRKRGRGAAGDQAAADGAQNDNNGGVSSGREDLGATSSEEEGWGWGGEGPPPTYEAYLKAEVLRAAHGEHLFHLCPKCGEGVELEEGTTRLHCPSCRADKCVSCGVDWHEGSTCEKYQEWARENAQADEAIKKMTEAGEIKPCPQCNTGIQKIDGCHHMTCTSCGCKFCYRCGAKKKGRYLQTHGCDCMNGAAWEHDYRARGNMRAVPNPPAPGAGAGAAAAAAAAAMAAAGGGAAARAARNWEIPDYGDYQAELDRMIAELQAHHRPRHNQHQQALGMGPGLGMAALMPMHVPLAGIPLFGGLPMPPLPPPAMMLAPPAAPAPAPAANNRGRRRRGQ